MKRAVLVALACVVATPVAKSERVDARVVMGPTIPRVCRAFNSWDKTEKCLAKWGKPTIARELPGAKLVSIASDSFRVAGLYLYKQRGKQWVMAGMYETSAAFEVRDLTHPTIDKRTGYRFDLALVESAGETETTGPGVLRQQISVFCGGTSAFCVAAVTSCELLVEGRAVETFRGKVSFSGTKVLVAGDRSRSGTMCSTPEEVALFFDAQTELDPML